MALAQNMAQSLKGRLKKAIKKSLQRKDFFPRERRGSNPDPSKLVSITLSI